MNSASHYILQLEKVHGNVIYQKEYLNFNELEFKHGHV